MLGKLLYHVKSQKYTCTINNQPVLKGLNLEVKAGEIHAIMGPNGSGKNTLASVISGNENHEVTEGDILYLNQSILDSSPEERARMGVFIISVSCRNTWSVS